MVGGAAVKAAPPEGAALEEIERAVVVYALEKNAGNIAAAARFLRCPRHILVYRIEKFEIGRPASAPTSKAGGAGSGSG